MSDKQSLAEAVKSIRRGNKLMKKSIAGIGRELPMPKEEPKGLTYDDGFSSLYPGSMPVVKRKLRLPKPAVVEDTPAMPDLTADEIRRDRFLALMSKLADKVESDEEKKEEEEEKKEEKKPVDAKELQVEKKPAKYRVRRTMTISI